MSVGEFLSDIGHAGRLFLDTIPVALGMAYAWAKEWQTLLTGVLLLIAARILSQASARAARIRATAMIRSAQIQAGETPNLEFRPKPVMPSVRVEPPPPPVSAEIALAQKVEKLRSLIRSAMSTLTTESANAAGSPNFFCERIADLRFDEHALPASLTPTAVELHQRLLTQLAVVRQGTQTKVSQAELSQALVQLNARAREFAAALMPGAALGAAAALGPAVALGFEPIKARAERKKAVSKQ